MALLIPAIEWGDLEIVGDTTNESTVIANIADTSLVEVDQVVYGSGIPYNSRVVSKTADSITLDQEATSTTSEVDLSLFYRHDFEYPPSGDEEDQYEADQTVTTSLSGVQQVTTNYIEGKRDLTFGFISKDDRDTLRDSFFKDWFILGKDFRYLDDKEVNSNLVYQQDRKDFRQKRQVKKHPNFLYEIKLRFRRVI